MNEWIAKFFTLGMTKEQINGFTMGSYRVVIAGALLGAYGALSMFGFDGFALAGDFKDKLDKSQQPILAKLQQLEANAAVTDTLLRKQLSAGIASQIRIQALKRCKAASGQREQFNVEIDRLQEEFKELNHDTEYRILDCGAL